MMVPKFTIKILNICDDVLYENEFGPYNEDTDLGDIIIDDCGEITLISGDPVDCNGNPVKSGIISILTVNGYETFKTQFENGHFEFAVPHCFSGNLQPVKYCFSAR